MLRSSTPQRLIGLAVVFALALGGCGGAPGEGIPQGAIRVSGAVSLPTGHGLDLSSLEVVTPYGSYPVESNGSYAALVMDGGDTELGVETASGDLLLLGVSDGTAAPLSLGSTAEALLYYLVGGLWLPEENQDTIRELLRGRPEANALAAELQRMLLAGDNGLLEPDDALMDALEAAHASLLGDAVIALGLGEAKLCPAELDPLAVDFNIIIHGGTNLKAGGMVLHNPSGVGIVVQNHLRRPAALLAYKTGWEDADHNVTAIEPPELAASVDVPATGQLEFFQALYDIVTGDAPWSPVLSEQLTLPAHDGAATTLYELVLVGPTLTTSKLPIWNDDRFTSFHDEWEEVMFDKSVELFLGELVLPLLGVSALGKQAKMDAAKLRFARERVKIIFDKHLLDLGVYLRPSQLGGYAAGLKAVLEQVKSNTLLRADVIDLMKETLGVSDARALSTQAMDKRLAARATAAAIAFAVETVLVSGDVTKILTDLAGAHGVASWQAEVAPMLFRIDPPEVVITPEWAVAKFEVRAVGTPPVGVDYRFRWTTSGHHGTITDLLQEEGVVIDTTSPEIWYFHNDPAILKASHIDTILLEVFVVDPGATEIPVDAKPVGKGQATVRGQGQEMCSVYCDPDGLCYIVCP